MQTDSPDAIEFRCNSCWQTNFAPVTQQDQDFTCVHCNQVTRVPQATPDRIRPAEVLQPKVTVEEPLPPSHAVDLLSEAEQMAWVRKEMGDPNGGDFSSYENASLLARFFASMLDSIFTGCTFGLAFLMLVGAAALGIIEAPGAGTEPQIDIGVLAILSFAPLVGVILQWNLIATRGQTVGKFVCCIRIVTMSGGLPGFVNGVILRNWVRVLLGAIPFFGLIDILFIFGESRRCIHDLIAGTRVVNA